MERERDHVTEWAVIALALIIDTETYHGLIIHENGGTLHVDSEQYGSVVFTY